MPIISRAEAFLKSLSDFVFLPYRIWRYFQYDQSYHALADGGEENTSWNFILESWAKAVGLATLEKPDQSPEVVVALIDSGMDYNHPILHSHLWLNPIFWIDPQGRKDRYGWDFFSGDSKPFDDGYHGTQIASVIVGINPHVKLMPLKVFNPWGMTTSAAIEAAFVYAVDHGAQVIVCAWATWIRSRALAQGLAYAQAHGVVVVTSAGDGGVDLAVSPTYPAHYARQFSALLTVTAVDDQDRLLGDVSVEIGEGQNRKANYSASDVQLAAPGVAIPVAEPRAEMQRASSSGLAAAFVTGALTRYWEAGQSAEQWINALLNDADVVPHLESAVAGGRRIHVRR
jgi:subtilisin family serine protease